MTDDADRFVDEALFLRSRGCRCPLRWSDGEPRPLARCEVGPPCADASRCWWIGDLMNRRERAFLDFARTFAEPRRG